MGRRCLGCRGPLSFGRVSLTSSQQELDRWLIKHFTTRSNANVLPMAFWNLIHIYNDRELLSCAEVEYRGCIVASPSSPTTAPASSEQSDSTSAEMAQDSSGELPLCFDIKPLLLSPLLQSVYAEALRMRVIMFHNRSPALRDYKFGPFTLRKGGLVILPTVVASHDSGLWGSSRTACGTRPLDQFWAERFLVPEKDQGSEASEARNSNSTKAADGLSKKMTFSTQGLEGAWIPYGGGSFTCPGRHLAKQEIMGTAAVFAGYFDMEVLNGVPCMDNRFFGMGTQPPGEPVPVRIRRKLGAVKHNSGSNAGDRTKGGSRSRNAWSPDWQE
jgi:hypothetical protein